MRKVSFDPWILGVFLGGFLYAAFFSQGIPLWDDDFTSWLWKIKDQSVFRFLWEWISPLSTQPEYWGFNERPLEALFYQFCFWISGYESWSYFFLKDLAYAGMGVMIYLWSLRLVPAGSQRKMAAVTATVFFLLTPGPLAAHIMQADFAPFAEFSFLSLTYVIWEQIEGTPTSWKSLKRVAPRLRKSWLKRWLALSILTYLAYKSKADLKLIPFVLGAYVLVVRRHQKFFTIPVLLMLFLAVPWGGEVLSKLPPFFPGSDGSEVNWMWQPASLGRLWDFIWNSEVEGFWDGLKSPTISLGGLFGPFLFGGIAVFGLSQRKVLSGMKWDFQKNTAHRAGLFVLIWLCAQLLAVSALSPINYIFRIRYGILTLVPACILLAGFLGFVYVRLRVSRVPRWLLGLVMVLLGFQAVNNLYRSIKYRRDLGAVMVAVDQVYGYVDHNHPESELALLPDFRPYDYHPDASWALLNRDWIKSMDDLDQRHSPMNTYVISWLPHSSEVLEMVSHFTGCRERVLFDVLFPCSPNGGAYLMRYLGKKPSS